MNQQANKTLIQMIVLASGGFCAVFIGMGIERFAYTPILTLYVSQKWLNANQANYLGSINLLGYMMGAFAAWHFIRRFLTPTSWIKISALLCSISLLASAYNGGFIWFSLWRLIAGYTGAILITTAPSLVLQNIPNEYAGRINGIIFTGTPLGILLSGFIVPLLNQHGLSAIWICFGLLSSISTAIVFLTFSQEKKSNPVKNNQCRNIAVNADDKIQATIINYLTVSYALSGFSFVPYTLFLVTYLTKLGFTAFLSGKIWILFGIGGVTGTFLIGYFGDIFGVQPTLIIGLLLGVIIFIMTILFSHIVLFYIYSFIIGMLLPSNVSLMCAAIKPIADNHQATWAKMTLYFAVGQTLGAYLISFLINTGFSYEFMFVLGGIGFLLAAASTVKAAYYHTQKRLVGELA